MIALVRSLSSSWKESMWILAVCSILLITTNSEATPRGATPNNQTVSNDRNLASGSTTKRFEDLLVAGGKHLDMKAINKGDFSSMRGPLSQSFTPKGLNFMAEAFDMTMSGDELGRIVLDTVPEQLASDIKQAVRLTMKTSSAVRSILSEKDLSSDTIERFSESVSKTVSTKVVEPLGFGVQDYVRTNGIAGKTKDLVRSGQVTVDNLLFSVGKDLHLALNTSVDSTAVGRSVQDTLKTSVKSYFRRAAKDDAGSVDRIVSELTPVVRSSLKAAVSKPSVSSGAALRLLAYTKSLYEGQYSKMGPMSAILRNMELLTVDPPESAEKANENYDGISQEYVGYKRTDKAFPSAVEGELDRTSATTGEGTTGVTTSTGGLTRITYPMLSRTFKYYDKIIDVSADTDDDTATSDQSIEINDPTLSMANLTADDEILKSQMMIYQTFADTQQSFLRDEVSRDRYLDMFQTVRAIAHMTLSYLDRTVAAGLATVQQQADQDLSHYLLKQISWQTGKIANPERQELYNDVDEKFEACLWAYGWSIAKLEDGDLDDDLYMNRISTDKKRSYYNIAGEPNSDDPYLAYVRSMCNADVDKENECSALYDKENSLIHYCTCCAERSLSPNVGTQYQEGGRGAETETPLLGLCHWWLQDSGRKSSGDLTNADEGAVYSLFERVVKGLREKGFELTVVADWKNTTVSNASTTPSLGDLTISTSSMAGLAQDMYGDYCTYKDHQIVRTHYMQPAISVEQQIKILRDGPPTDDTYVSNWGYFFLDRAANDSANKGTTSWKYGICPSFKKILNLVKENKFESEIDSDDELKRMWVEASIATPLTMDDFNNVKDMADQSEEYSTESQSTFIENFCDAAAVRAYERMHQTMKKVLEDHMALNANLTKGEKDIVHRILARVDMQVAMARQDADTNIPQDMLIAAEQSDSRSDQATRSSSASSSGSRSSMNRLTYDGTLGSGSF